MFMHIVQGTPVHVWALLAGLIVLGVSQSRPRTLGPVRVAVLPLAMTALSLALNVGLFAVKYAAGVSLAMHPGLSRETLFALPVGLAYGLFKGSFAARGWQMWRARGAGSAVTRAAARAAA